MPKKRNNIYDPLYISKRDNISICEAQLKIDEMKKNKSTSLEGFIKRHGEELGLIKFNKFKETSKHTLKKYIDKYGYDEGHLKWLDYLSKKDSTSFNWALNKTNGDHDKALELFNNRIKNLSIKYDKSYFIDKYGEENAETEMIKFQEKKDTSSYKWALNKANGDKDLADAIYLKRCEGKCVSLGKASKESLSTFEPLVDWLLNIGFSNDDIYYGVKSNKEICLYDSLNKKRYYYDFCIKSLNLIIEYNGDKFHPNYFKYDEKYLESFWKHPYDKNSKIKDLINKDKQKIKLAIENGYDIHVIWSSDLDKIEKVKKIIQKKIQTDENKKYKQIHF